MLMTVLTAFTTTCLFSKVYSFPTSTSTARELSRSSDVNGATAFGSPFRQNFSSSNSKHFLCIISNAKFSILLSHSFTPLPLPTKSCLHPFCTLTFYLYITSFSTYLPTYLHLLYSFLYIPSYLPTFTLPLSLYLPIFTLPLSLPIYVLNLFQTNPFSLSLCFYLLLGITKPSSLTLYQSIFSRSFSLSLPLSLSPFFLTCSLFFSHKLSVYFLHQLKYFFPVSWKISTRTNQCFCGRRW